MKRIAILMVTVLLGLTATANSVHYFTRSQADRAVSYLNRQNELMIYCGYEYEIETYVLINEVWAERVNSAYYELWIYGWDAYTGDEIYMPLDLQCVWLYGAGRMYNAAQYLRFRTSIHTPHIVWYVPAYHPFTRVMHRPGYVRSYHYDIHRHGWMPPHHPHHGPAAHPPLPPYYMRDPHTPAPAPQAAWTPGVDHPTVVSTPRGSSATSGSTTTSSPRNSNTRPSTGSSNTRGTATSGSSNTRSSSGSATSSSSNTRSSSGTSTSSSSSTRSTNNTPTRSNTGTTSNTRSSSGTTTSSSSNTRSSSSTSTDNKSNTRSSSGTTTSTRSSNTRTSSGTSTSGSNTRTSSGSANNKR